MSNHSTATFGTVVPEAAYEMWRRALAEPSLRDLPFKVETNGYGQLVLSPHKVRHSVQQGRIAARLRDLFAGTANETGEAVPEFAVETAGGIKVPDVVWISAALLRQVPPDAEASPVMPELVIEVLSESNTAAEVEEKQRLYFEAGAIEFWTCSADGKITFFMAGGPAEASALVPGFPERID